MLKLDSDNRTYNKWKQKHTLATVNNQDAYVFDMLYPLLRHLEGEFIHYTRDFWEHHQQHVGCTACLTL